jgi:hypothetical protein
MKQHEKIMALMLSHPEKEWWYAPDFQQPDLGQFFVGYEASARISELPKHYPGKFEFERKGKYRYVRLKRDSVPIPDGKVCCRHGYSPEMCMSCKRDRNIENAKNPPEAEGGLF